MHTLHPPKPVPRQALRPTWFVACPPLTCCPSRDRPPTLKKSQESREIPQTSQWSSLWEIPGDPEAFSWGKKCPEMFTSVS